MKRGWNPGARRLPQEPLEGVARRREDRSLKPMLDGREQIDRLDDPGERARLRSALERLVAIAEPYVDRGAAGDFWGRLDFWGQSRETAKRHHELARRAFLGADREAGLVQLTPRAYVWALPADEAASVAAGAYTAALGPAWRRWGCEIDHVREGSAAFWCGWRYPRDFPDSPRYSIEPGEMALLRYALRLATLADETPRGSALPLTVEEAAAATLRKEGRARPAMLIEFMADREAASYDELKEHVHGDRNGPDNSVVSNARRTSQLLERFGSPLRYHASCGVVAKERLDR